MLFKLDDDALVTLTDNGHDSYINASFITVCFSYFFFFEMLIELHLTFILIFIILKGVKPKSYIATQGIVGLINKIFLTFFVKVLLVKLTNTIPCRKTNVLCF